MLDSVEDYAGDIGVSLNQIIEENLRLGRQLIQAG